MDLDQDLFEMSGLHDSEEVFVAFCGNFSDIAFALGGGETLGLTTRLLYYGGLMKSLGVIKDCVAEAYGFAQADTRQATLRRRSVPNRLRPTWT